MYLSFLIASMDSLPPGCFDSPAGSVLAGNHVATASPWLDDSSDSGNEYQPMIRAASSAGGPNLQKQRCGFKLCTPPRTCPVSFQRHHSIPKCPKGSLASSLPCC